jgi:23S rRNA (uracil1939-C5)-methyltransferase
MKIDFNIDHIDPLGQGVSKNDGRVTFIKKTLPGESGDAALISSKKGVQFAKLSHLTTFSTDRITPECVHFDKCNGCDFLHTSYQNEKQFKLNTLTRQLTKFSVKKIEFHEAKKRFEYRNRLQLHYDLDKKILGLLDAEFNIVEVPNCKIGTPEIKLELSKLYQNQYWISLLKKHERRGHIEIYYKENAIQTSINSQYAEGGFTQVNLEMNVILNNFVSSFLNKNLSASDSVLDLFGGNGNLSNQIKQKTWVVDQYTQLPKVTTHQSFTSIDLYSMDALNTLKKFCKEASWILVDPPRSGLKNIHEFLNHYQPQGFVYVSCQSASFVRDTLPLLDQYELTSIDLFDLFPGTHHFETVGIFTRRKLP